MSDQHFQLTPGPPHEFTMPQTGRNRILGETLKSLIALAKAADPANLDLDKLVQEGKRIQEGKGMTPGNIQAFKLFYQAAHAGHPEAQYLISEYYDFELGVEIDRAEYLYWLIRSAESGFAAAQNSLGFELFTEDSIEAAKWFKMAAKQNFAGAMLNLGRLADGAGNGAEVISWYLKAAEMGNSLAQLNLGDFYNSGTYVNKDDHEAANWWTKAANHGEGRAQFELGMSYATGRGVSQDDAEAVRWWIRAAERGFSRAYYHLGESYASGKGIQRSNVEAYRWLRIAAREGVNETISKKADAEAAALERLMSSKEIEEGLKLCREFSEQDRTRKPRWLTDIFAKMAVDETWQPLNENAQ